MLLAELSEAFIESKAGLVIDDQTVEKLLKDAVRFYTGYATLAMHPPLSIDDGGDGVHSIISPDNDLGGIEITASEWVVIRPLFALYVEREVAIHLEASRGLGIDVFGRQVSEVTADINACEEALPKKAFVELPSTV